MEFVYVRLDWQRPKALEKSTLKYKFAAIYLELFIDGRGAKAQKRAQRGIKGEV